MFARFIGNMGTLLSGKILRVDLASLNTLEG
jgi:hypothetical protein